MNRRNLERVLIIAVLLGIAVQYVGITLYEPEHGAALQAAMAKGFLKYGSLIMEYGPIFDEHNLKSAPSQHFPPLYPLIIATNAGTPWFDIDFLKIVSFRLVLITTLLILLMSSWLFGRIAGLFITSSFLLHPVFLDNSAKCLGEYVQIILLSTFLLCIILSGKNHRMFIYAGLILGLAYLSKSTLPFWLVITVVTVCSAICAMRMKHAKLHIITGFILFLAIVLSWAFRNYMNHESYETSLYIASSLSLNKYQFPLLLMSFSANFVVMSFVVIVPLVLFYPSLKHARPDDPIDFLLIIFTAVSFLFAVLYASLFMVMESNFQPFNSVRYAMISYIPLMWIIARHTDFNMTSAIKRSLIMTAILLISALTWLYMAYTVNDKPLINEADIALARYIIEEGIFDNAEHISIQFSKDINKNDFYYYLFALESKYLDSRDIHLLDIKDVSKSRALIRNHIYKKTSALIIGDNRYSSGRSFAKYAVFNRAGKLTDSDDDTYRQLWLRNNDSRKK